MDLDQYFKGTKGTGVLATADHKGRVDAALYARPHIFNHETVIFIMPDRLTHHNLQSNDRAAYLFMEEGDGYKGVRLFLTKVREEGDCELLHDIRRKKYAAECEAEENCCFLVYFKVDKVLPLIGAEEDL
jgi:hypothetical protein